MTAVKVCGLMRREDVALACAVGASLLGFNFSDRSPRRVTPAVAAGLAEVAGPGVQKVGVFVFEEASLIREAVEAARLDWIQIHRALRPDDVEEPAAPVIAVSHVGAGGAEPLRADLLARCGAILFDTRDGSSTGGTGRAFDWRAIAAGDYRLPVLLAGGLNAGNVEEAVRLVKPWAVDVASGVESAPGVKDAEKLRLFFQAVRRADAEPT